MVSHEYPVSVLDKLIVNMDHIAHLDGEVGLLLFQRGDEHLFD